MSKDGAEAFLRRPVRSALSLLGLGALGFACVLVVTACGSSSNAASGTTTAAATTAPATTGTTTTPATSASFAAYEKCIVAHGGTAFTGGTGGFGGGFGGEFGRGAGTSTTATTTTPASTGTTTTPRFTRPPVSAAEQKAMTACASLRPARGAGAGGARGGGFANSPQYAKFEQCLKSHGVTTTTGGAGGFGGGSSADRSAIAACRSDLPAGGFGGAGARPGGGAGGGANSTSFQKLQACLKSHGVNPSATGSTSPAKLQAAYAACQTAAGTTTTTTTSG